MGCLPSPQGKPTQCPCSQRAFPGTLHPAVIRRAYASWRAQGPEPRHPGAAGARAELLAGAALSSSGTWGAKPAHEKHFPGVPDALWLLSFKTPASAPSQACACSPGLRRPARKREAKRLFFLFSQSLAKSTAEAESCLEARTSVGALGTCWGLLGPGPAALGQN